MLLTPFFAAAILLREVHWLELVALVAVVCAFALKDPLVVLARQRFVWRERHPETSAARTAALIQFLILAACGAGLMLAQDWRPFLPLFAGAGVFTALAVALTVRNKQRSEWFQTASAVALTSTCLIACLAARGSIPAWCWLLWALCALQATAGIFVVHARLDARIAARNPKAANFQNRRAAFVLQTILLASGAAAALFAHPWAAGALAAAAACYLLELRRQKNPASLQMPLKHVGLQALGLSTAFALFIVADLWKFR